MILPAEGGGGGALMRVYTLELFIYKDLKKYHILSDTENKQTERRP